MTGLLYKDFLAIKGKALTVTYMIIFTATIILRFLIPSVFLQVEDADMNLADMMADGLYWVTGMLLFIMIIITVIGRCPSKLIDDDKTRGRVFNYYSSLPIKKNQYIASHYVFIGIMTYVVFSLTMIWYIIGSAISRCVQLQPLWSITLPIILSMVYLVLSIAAVDLGAFFSLGTSKGKVVRIAMFLILGTVILWFICFGDVESMKNINPEMIVKWMTTHQFELSLIEIMGPFVVLAFYYLSYRISCRFCDKGAY